MPKTIELIFDFVSPNAYLAWWPLKDLAKEHGADITVTPVFLGGMHKLTGNAPPFMRDAEVKGKNAYAMLEMQRFIKKHALTKFQMNPNFPFNSITLQRILTAVESDKRIALVDALLPAIWENGLDVSDGNAVKAVISEAGFDDADLMTRAQGAVIKQQLIDNTEHAVARGAFGIPTFFVGEEMFFGKERLGQIAEMLA